VARGSASIGFVLIGCSGSAALKGHSAGAHIAAMLSIDGRWLGKVGLNPHRDVAGLIGLAGPYDLMPLPLRDKKN